MTPLDGLEGEPVIVVHVDHPHTDPGDARSECPTCGKFVWLVTHSCKGVPVTQTAVDRMNAAPVPVSDEAEADMTEAEEAWLRWMFENADMFNTDRLSFIAGFNAARQAGKDEQP